MAAGTAAGLGLAAALRAGVVRVAGPSMEPTLKAGDLVVTWPARVGRRSLRPGDVVVVVDPAGRTVIKRVSAGPGGWADVMDGPVRVPPGHVAVAGDAPGASTDSRHYGPVPVAAVRARAVLAVRRRPLSVRRLVPAIGAGGEVQAAPSDADVLG